MLISVIAFSLHLNSSASNLTFIQHTHLLHSLPCTALHCSTLHYTHYTTPPCTALHCTALHCTALNCTALHCTALTILYFPVQSNSVMPGGMKIRPYCCAADNAGANEYKLPCNTATPGIMHSSLVLILALGAAFYTALS
jgi:hypothetical protein